MSYTPGLNNISGPIPVSGDVNADIRVGGAAVSGTNPVPTQSSPLTVLYDDAGSGVTYIGKALPGTSTASAAWSLSKLDESSTPDFSLKWADGTGAFTKTYDDRASYSYS